MAIKETTSEDL